MSNASKKLMGTTSTAGGFTAIEDVFSTYLYTGNASTQTITNGIDLAGEGGLVWVKNRGLAVNHALHDTERGPEYILKSNSTAASDLISSAAGGVSSFNSDGFSLYADTVGLGWWNASAQNYASWTFRKAPRFFDVVTYTGTGIGNRSVAHNLELPPAVAFIKSTTEDDDWVVYHKDADGDLNLNTADKQHYADATSVSMPSTAYNRITYNQQNGSLVALRYFAYNGTANSVSYSNNGGTSWTSVSTGISGSYSNILGSSYANGYHYLSVHDNGGSNTYKLLYSADGSSWFSAISTPTNTNFDPIRYSKNLGLYFATAQNHGYYWTSVDGTSWTQRNYPSGVSNMLGAATESVLVVFQRGTSGTYYTSTDGINWTARSNPYGSTSTYLTSSNGDKNNENSVIFINKYNSVPSYTYDGVTWSSLGYFGSAGSSTFDQSDMHYANGWYAYMNGLGYLMRTNIGTNVQVTTSVESWYAAEDYYGVVFSGTLSKISANKSVPIVSDKLFYVNNNLNNLGQTYVAYLYAHDPLGPSGDGSDGLISCGSYTGNGLADGPEIDLGWEPQWVLIKNADAATSGGITCNWRIYDSMRGFTTGGSEARLFPNLNNAENSANDADLTATGFKITNSSGSVNGIGENHIYIAIRRGPMKVPESGTEVFAVDTMAGFTLPSWKSGFPVDMNFWRSKTSAYNWELNTRITNSRLFTNLTNAESAISSNGEMDYSNGFGSNTSTDSQYQAWMFRRAPNFFDVVAYTGDGVAGRTVPHNLGVAPEMMWVKQRSSAGFYWAVYYGDNTSLLQLNENAAAITAPHWNNTSPTDEVFYLGTQGQVNRSPETYIAYLFATLAGVSKVGSYTGNGTSQTINCGFTTGARFILIKRTDSTGDWYVWDTERGIVAANDPHLSLNTTAAEVTTDDSVDPDSSGFIVNQLAATNINVTSASYIFYAIA